MNYTFYEAVRDIDDIEPKHIEGPGSKHDMLYFGYDLRQHVKGHKDYILPVKLENGQMGSIWYIFKDKKK